MDDYETMAERFNSGHRIFIGRGFAPANIEVPEPDSRPVDVNALLLDLSNIDVKKLRANYESREAQFDTAPFDPLGARLRFYRGDVTVWSGFPGAGKTTLLRQLVCHLLHAGREVFLASLEEDPRDLLWRLICTAAGTLYPNDHQAQWFVDEFSLRLRIWSVLGASGHVELLRTIRALGSAHAVIDSMMALDVNGYDWEAQRLFIKRVVGSARMFGAHIHLVAHPKKPMQSGQLPDISDVAGSSDLGRLVDNVLFIRRQADEASAAAATGMEILVRKQRHFRGELATYQGHFHREYLQYHTQRFPEGPTRYLPQDAYEP